MANKYKRREEKKHNNQEPTDMYGKSPDQEHRDKRNKKANAWRNEIDEYFEKKNHG